MILWSFRLDFLCLVTICRVLKPAPDVPGPSAKCSVPPSFFFSWRFWPTQRLLGTSLFAGAPLAWILPGRREPRGVAWGKWQHVSELWAAGSTIMSMDGMLWACLKSGILVKQKAISVSKVFWRILGHLNDSVLGQPLATTLQISSWATHFYDIRLLKAEWLSWFKRWRQTWIKGVNSFIGRDMSFVGCWPNGFANECSHVGWGLS
jgi:hypothetical protein